MEKKVQLAAAAVVALAMALMSAGRGADAAVFLQNRSDFAVTVSNNATNPRAGTVVPPEGLATFGAGIYYFTNQYTVELDMGVDGASYGVQNAVTTVGRVQAYVVVLPVGTLAGPVGSRVLVSGEF